MPTACPGIWMVNRTNNPPLEFSIRCAFRQRRPRSCGDARANVLEIYYVAVRPAVPHPYGGGSMMFDEQARNGLYVSMQARGYRGELEEMMTELRAQSYGAEVRLFVSHAVSVTLRDYPDALQFVERICHLVQTRFGRVSTSTYDLSSSADIVFSPCKRQVRTRGEPLRMDCVAITAAVRSRVAEVRLQGYIENKLRRDTSRTFQVPKKKGRGL